jgi:hypothetical protein
LRERTGRKRGRETDCVPAVRSLIEVERRETVAGECSAVVNDEGVVAS